MEIRKKFKAEVAHRLVSSYSKDCQNIHGHSYTYDIVLKSGELNCDGMVMDFGEVKAKAKEFMDKFDHCLVLSSFDPITSNMRPIMDRMGMKYMIVPYNSTAENQAAHIYQQFHEFGLNVVSVRVHETLTGYAEFDGSDDIQDICIDLDAVEFVNA